MYSYKNTKALRKHTRIINTSICSHNRPHPLTLGVVHQLMCVVWWAVPFVALVENLKRSWLDCLVDYIIKITFLATENSRPWGKKKKTHYKKNHTILMPKHLILIKHWLQKEPLSHFSVRKLLNSPIFLSYGTTQLLNCSSGTSELPRVLVFVKKHLLRKYNIL